MKIFGFILSLSLIVQVSMKAMELVEKPSSKRNRESVQESEESQEGSPLAPLNANVSSENLSAPSFGQFEKTTEMKKCRVDVYKSTDRDESSKQESDSPAQVRMLSGRAYNYYTGTNVAKNYREAFRYFQKAAESGGCPLMLRQEALFVCGEIYFRGVFGVNRSYAHALKFFLLVAQSGGSLIWVQEACFKIAAIYSEGGYGIEKDSLECLNYMKKAVSIKTVFLRPDSFLSQYNREHVRIRIINCLFDIADFYRAGAAGIPQNHREALAYYLRAIKEKEALINSEIYASADIKILCKRWLYALRIVGGNYKEGENVPKSYGQAIKYLVMAANNNDNLEQQQRDLYFVAAMYLEGGYGMSKNCRQAIRYFKKCARINANDQFQIAALEQVARIYRFGDATLRPNYSLALKYYGQLRSHKSIQPQMALLFLYDMGTIYQLGGHGIEHDHAKAKNCFEQLLEQDIDIPIDIRDDARKRLNEVSMSEQPLGS